MQFGTVTGSAPTSGVYTAPTQYNPQPPPGSVTALMGNGSLGSTGGRSDTSGGGSGTSNSNTGVNLFSQNTSFIPFNYTTGSSLGTLSLNIPTNFLGGNSGGGGLNFNIDFGPNADTIAKNAYAYDASQAQNDFAFLGSTIAQTQNFVSNQITPLVSAATSGMGDYFNNLLGAFNSSLTASQSAVNSVLPQINNNTQSAMTNINANAALAAQVAQQNAALAAQNAQASIAASQSAANNSGGGCYITTAVCEYAGEKDDCELLTILRKWRDDFVSTGIFGRNCIEIYYHEAPRIVSALRMLPKNRQVIVFARIRRIIKRAASAIRRGHSGEALIYYVRGIALAKEYANG